MKQSNVNPIFFSHSLEFRNWLEQNHQTAKELQVGFYKVGSKQASMTWSESVDQALCYGWIDGVRKSIDDKSYTIRFTPRRKDSIWSAVNIAKIEALKKEGLMTKAGLDVFEYRSEEKSKIYSFEKDEAILTPEFERKFKENERAWKYFQNLPASYKKASLNWIMSAKQEITQWKRLLEIIADSENETNKWKHNKYTKK